MNPLLRFAILQTVFWMISGIFTVTFARQIPTDEEEVAVDTVWTTDTPAYTIPAATRFTREDIESRKAAVVYDVLEGVQGLHVVQRLAFTGAGLTRLVIRGAGGEGPTGLQLFIDGRPDPTVTFVHPAPQAHNAVNVALVEVIRGPSPVLFGSGNTGVVNIRRTSPRMGWSGHVVASGGSYGTSENFAAFNYGWDRGYFGTELTYRRTDGYLPEDTDAWVAGGNIRLGYQFAPNWRLRLNAGVSGDHFAVFGPFSVPGPFGNPGTTELDLTQTAGDLTVEGRLGKVSASAMVWADVLTPRSQVVPEGAERADVYEAGSRLKAIAGPWKSGTLTVGADLLYGSARNRPALPPTAPEVDVDITQVDPYVFLNQSVSSWLKLNAGVRLANHSEYGSVAGYEGGVVLYPGADNPASPWQNTRLKFRMSRGFQSPALQQLFGVFRGTTTGPANPELKPERVTQWEAEVQQRTRRVSFRITGWYQDGSEIIVPVRGELQNAGEFEHYGIEAMLQIRPMENLLVEAAITRYDLSENLLRVPWNTFDFSLRYKPRSLQRQDVTLSLYGYSANKTFDQAVAPGSLVVRLDDYFVINGKVQFRLIRSAYAFVEGRNLTDEAYQTVLNIPMPGLSLYGGVSLRW